MVAASLKNSINKYDLFVGNLFMPQSVVLYTK